MGDLTKEINELKNDVSELMDVTPMLAIQKIYQTLQLLERLSQRVDGIGAIVANELDAKAKRTEQRLADLEAQVDWRAKS